VPRGPDDVQRLVSWDGVLLRIDMPYAERVRFVDQELVLSPSVTQWSHLLVQVCCDDASLVYPTSRVVRSSRDASALAELLGRTRAGILRDLAVERTPTDLAARHSLAKPTVSHHLRVLVRTGLVYREPEGKQIHYGLTSRGRSLVNG
jgi:DNA-binding transcriptional ArsR family regulator